MAHKLSYRKEELVSMYQSGMSFYRIAKEIGEYEQAVSNVIRSVIYIPKKERLKIKENYFKSIDSVGKAYFLGLIAADGAIVRNSDGYLTMTISLSSEDGYILEVLKRETEAETTVKEYAQSYQKEDGTTYTQSRFVTANQNFVQNLIDLGMTERKSMSLPNLLEVVEEEFRIDFIRGYFDGDGSIFKTVTSGIQERHYCSIRGTEAVLLGIKVELPFNGGSILWGSNGTPSGGQFDWRFGAKKDIKTFRDLIYHDNIEDYYLTRKYNKFPG